MTSSNICFTYTKCELHHREHHISNIVTRRFFMMMPTQSIRRKRSLKQLQLIILNVIVVMMMYWVWYMTSVSTIRGIRLIECELLVSFVRCLRRLEASLGQKNMSLEEIVAIILYTLAHHKKNRSIAHFFIRSGETVSHQFNLCLRAILKLHDHLLYKPTPILEECEDERWKPFKNCLGASDSTYINVNAHSQERGKYRTRKGTIATNVLGVCAPKMLSIYVLLDWEGSAHDVRVLCNALSRPHGFRVPRGYYYLVGGGYTNCEGFLAPYRGQRYHLKEWTNKQPQTAEEYYNMKHAQARNVIERCFGLLKGRWSILRSPSFFLFELKVAL
ncbi:protein ALP1-like [Amaranthus tricolor]|uniref:protein ALP1-like n=1 Tax=Amaranthus tricolor TaxID=29722 RepID=UPI00258556D8|nr:protein ALP1-like [Amaranthus tricolor]